MIIDASHRRWIVATTALFLVSTVLYVIYANRTLGGPSGGTVPGLLFGIAGTGLMLFAGLLSARKRYPTVRVGRASTWLKGHIWLGLLSFPLILYHAAFRWGGAVERALWIVLAIVIVSGLVGLAFQAYIPRVMTTRVPLETVYEQIEHVCGVMQEETDELIEAVCGPLPEDVKPPDGEHAKGKKKGKPEVVEGSAPLEEFYLRQVRPFLSADFDRKNRLADEALAVATFEQMRKRLPPTLEEPLEQLAGYCEERRQLAMQKRLHHWLHGWLFMHVPLSFALLGLGIAHVVMSLYY